ncbi:hypothetical protein LWF15_14435 [Kineosporia rhizophila]|uniref:hypothetical protein n=1 Tax=Kineosporia TaxID=49184 RepID=UPI001E62BAE4|nr:MULTISPECIES: hypothetical protein [Kineosporia]MCE0536702.1 hypothetical protein [Kineosporia rhizophila]
MEDLLNRQAECLNLIAASQQLGGEAVSLAAELHEVFLELGARGSAERAESLTVDLQALESVLAEAYSSATATIGRVQALAHGGSSSDVSSSGLLLLRAA